MSAFSRITIIAVTLLLVPWTAAQPASRPMSGPFRIAGTVVSSTSGHGLARVQVTIADTKNRESTQTVTSSEEGRFEFHVVAGKYSLQAAKRGFITSAYNQHEQFSTAIVTGAGVDTENLSLRLAAEAVLAGKVIDESGDPVRQAAVTLYREDRRSGMGRILPFNRESTDDQGAFEFAPLDGATYFVSVSAKPWYAVHPITSQAGVPPPVVDEAVDVAYPVTYYGDVTEADDATPIPLRGGDHLDVEIHLSPLPALHLTYHTTNTQFDLPTLQKPSFDGMEAVDTDGMQQISPGVFELTGVPPGRYSVRMAPGAGFPGAADVDLTSNGQELSPPEESNGSVKLTVRVAGGAPLPRPLQVALRNARGRFAGISAVDEKGEAEFPDLAPGKYQLIARSSTKAFSVGSIRSQNSDSPGNSLTVLPGAPVAATISLISGDAAVEGTAKRDGKPFDGAMVVLVPNDPEAHRDLFRRDQTDLDGTFTLRGVVPGTYTILAIEDGWDLDWAKPAVIEHYAKRGQSVVVKENVAGSVKVTDPVAVQMK